MEHQAEVGGLGAFGQGEQFVHGSRDPVGSGERQRDPEGGVHVTRVVGGVEAHHGVGVEALRGAVREAQLRTFGAAQVDGRGNQVVVLVCRRVDEEAAKAAVHQGLPRVAAACLDPALVEGVGVIDAENGLTLHGDGEAHQIGRTVDDDLHVVVVSSEDAINLASAHGQRFASEGGVVAGSQRDSGAVRHLDVVAGGSARIREGGQTAFHERGSLQDDAPVVHGAWDFVGSRDGGHHNGIGRPHGGTVGEEIKVCLERRDGLHGSVCPKTELRQLAVVTQHQTIAFHIELLPDSVFVIQGFVVDFDLDAAGFIFDVEVLVVVAPLIGGGDVTTDDDVGSYGNGVVRVLRTDSVHGEQLGDGGVGLPNKGGHGGYVGLQVAASKYSCNYDKCYRYLFHIL